MSSKTSPRIVFMGTPAFAVASLDALVKAGFQVVAVITAPDKPAGRGLKITTSAVKEYAVAAGIPVMQPPKLRDPEFVEELRSFKADLQVIVAFRMLPEMVWSMPPLGTINVHASLLPKYRGAAPINWAIINGEKESGVTTFKLAHDIDTGNILMQQKVPVSEYENAGNLHDKLSIAGAELLTKTITGIIEGTVKEQPQTLLTNEEATLVHAPKIFTETCRIDFNQSVNDVYNLIRGLSPFPGAFTEFDNKVLKIFRAEKYTTLNSGVPGSSETDGRSYLRFACNNGYVYAKDIQPEGKKRMNVEDFLRGYRP